MTTLNWIALGVGVYVIGVLILIAFGRQYAEFLDDRERERRR